MNILEFLKPINIKDEQDKFFNSHRYNPIFTYNWDREQIKKWLSEKTQKKYTHLVDAVLNQNHDEIVSEAKKIFSTDISDNFLDQAKDIIAQPVNKITGQTVEDLAQQYQKSFEHFDINYKIIISNEAGSAVKPTHSNKTLTINSDQKLDYASCQGLVRHEMVHIIKAVNAEYNGIEKSDAYLPTEEGLACFMQDYRGGEMNNSLIQHAMRYVVADIGLKGSFRDIVEYLQGMGMEKNLAFRRAVRHKSGFVDTSKPGDIMKSSMYFYNLQKISQLSDDQILRLFVGKISVGQLDGFREYQGKIDREKLVGYFQLEKTRLNEAKFISSVTS